MKVIALLLLSALLLPFSMAIAKDIGISPEEQAELEKQMQIEMLHSNSLATLEFRNGIKLYNLHKYGPAMERFVDSLTTVPSSAAYYYFAKSFYHLENSPDGVIYTIMHLQMAADLAERDNNSKMFKKAWTTIGDIYREHGKTELAKVADYYAETPSGQLNEDLVQSVDKNK